MSAPISEWLPFDASQPKKRRAENVCLLCHSKKIKCDLQARSQTGRSGCSNCEASRRECQPRTSRRTKRGSHATTTSSSSTTTTTNNNNKNNTHTASFKVSPPQPQRQLQQPQYQEKPLTPDTATSESTVHAPPPPPPPPLPSSDHRSSFAAGDIRTLLSPDFQDIGTTPPARTESLFVGSTGRSSVELTTTPLPPIMGGGGPGSQHGGGGGGGGGLSSLIHPSPSQRSMHSDRSRADLVTESIKGDIDTGFLQVYGPENEIEAQKETVAASFQLQWNPGPDLGEHSDLMESFADTYLEYCYPFCPVIDPGAIFDEVARSPLLANAVALAGSHVQPPLVPHSGSAEYYARARSLFYNDEEPDMLATLKAISLFYWWAPKTATIVHRSSSWWWTSVVIRHAQQMDFHREPTVKNLKLTEYTQSIRRRIWWTAYARERLTALCQSKPAIVDPADCNVREPSLADFPDDPAYQRKGEVFIRWVRLCGIMGRLAKTLYRPEAHEDRLSTSTQHVYELSDWINSLPPHLQLPIQSARTQRFDRDVHQLHLPYLTTVIILHLKKRSGHSLPQALPPAIMAAYCISRILRDILARGNSRFLMAITCWYTGSAFIPLLQASHIPHLAKDANECLDVLERTAEQLQTMWASANLIVGAFRRLRRATPEAATVTAAATAMASSSGGPTTAESEAIAVAAMNHHHGMSSGSSTQNHHHHQQQQQQQQQQGDRQGGVSDLKNILTPVMGGGGGGASTPGASSYYNNSNNNSYYNNSSSSSNRPRTVDGEGFDWLNLFPFVTHETSSIAASLLNDRDQGVVTRVFPSPENTMYNDALMSQLGDMFVVDGIDFMTCGLDIN